MKLRRIALAWIALLTAGATLAVTPAMAAQESGTATSTAATSRERTSTTEHSDAQQARDWGLRSEEWARYRELMQGPLGVYSPQLDPLTALGIEAQSDEDRRRYAELQVRIEARRVERLLAYQRAYDAAWQRLHPGAQRVVLPGAGTATPAATTSSDRLALFVKEGCGPCDQAVRQLQAAGTGFDVYVVGSRGDDARIRAWAQRAGIDAAKVRSGHITLNHDSGRWLSLELQGDLPAVVRQVNGQWRRQP